MYRGPRVLALGLDAVEPAFVERLSAQGRLPNLARLMERGKTSQIASAAHIGSGAVWPTFMTGTDPVHHGVSHEWVWDPATMSVSRFTTEGLDPFWRTLADRGMRVGVFDVPYAPTLGFERGFEVSEWGPHDVLTGSTAVNPQPAAAIVASSPRHVFADSHALAEDDLDDDHLEALSRGALEGIAVRGELFARLVRACEVDLGILVFPEIHHVGHLLWHTVEQDADELARPTARTREISPSLPDLMQAIDEQIGRLASLLDADGSMVVFSLHGMTPANGVPGILGPMMRTKGFATAPTMTSMTSRERARALFAILKHRSPRWLRNLYHRRVDQMVQLRLARSTMLEQQDWSRTRAFALPTDQHGVGRINLQGRESRGIVAPAEFDAECDRIEDELRGLKTEAGDALVEHVVRPKRRDPSLRNSRLPDLIVHWSSAAHHRDLRIDGVGPDTAKVGHFRTGQHTSNAFCVTVGPLAERMPDVTHTEDLGSAIAAEFDAGAQAD